MYFWNLFLPALHLGQIHLFPRSSKEIPGGVSVLGSPFSGLYTYPHSLHLYLSIFLSSKCLHRPETIYPCAAMGAIPVIRKIFEGCALLSVVSWFSCFRVIYIATYFTFIPFHFKPPSGSFKLLYIIFRALNYLKFGKIL